MRISGSSLPQASPWPVRERALNAIKIEHPPIELSPNFLCRIEPGDLTDAARCYNPSICLHNGRRFMAYRAESYAAVSKVHVAFLDSEMRVEKTIKVNLPEDDADCHWEDPRLASINGRLYIMAAYIRLVIPPVCRQRMFEVGDWSFEPVAELCMTYGKLGGIEKNWTPMELENGRVGFVYLQRPRVIIDVESAEGFESPAVAMGPFGTSLSGRAPPIKVGDSYLEFVGGWVRIPERHGRYWYGAQLLSLKAPYQVTHYTKEPLLWGSEGSPTIHSPRPGAGHPVCVFPGGSMLENGDVIVSIGVNDSYCVLMRYSVRELIDRMVPV